MSKPSDDSRPGNTSRSWPRKYSGDASKAFWDRIGKLWEKTDQHIAYDLGLILQDTETRVLKALAVLEQKKEKRRAKR